MSDKSVPSIFDRRLRRWRRERHQPEGTCHAFIAEMVAADLGARLALIRRNFGQAVILGARTARMRSLFRQALPGTMLYFGLCHPPAPEEQEKQDVFFVLDEENWPVGKDKIDLIASLLELHAVNDLPGTLLLLRQSLRPDGLFLAALFGQESLFELRHAMTLAETEALGGSSPHIFPFVDLRDLGALLQRAGFALSVTDCERLEVSYSHVLDLLRDLRGMGEGNILVQRARRGLRRDLLARLNEIYSEHYGTKDKLRASFDILHLSGWAPAPHQQQPLQPGSATHRLADALGTREYSLPDRTRPNSKD
jgi:SAM-dependent methyltransferase